MFCRISYEPLKHHHHLFIYFCRQRHPLIGCVRRIVIYILYHLLGLLWHINNYGLFISVIAPCLCFALRIISLIFFVEHLHFFAS